MKWNETIITIQEGCIIYLYYTMLYCAVMWCDAWWKNRLPYILLLHTKHQQWKIHGCITLLSLSLFISYNNFCSSSFRFRFYIFSSTSSFSLLIHSSFFSILQNHYYFCFILFCSVLINYHSQDYILLLLWVMYHIILYHQILLYL